MSATTYSAYHLNAVSSFDPTKSWILSSTATPTQAKKVEPITLPPQPSTQPHTAADPAQMPTRFTHSPPTLVASQHVLYRTSNAHYGATIPSVHEMPSVWHGRPYPFSSEFAGGMFRQNGLETGVKSSRIVDEKREMGW